MLITPRPWIVATPLRDTAVLRATAGAAMERAAARPRVDRVLAAERSGGKPAWADAIHGNDAASSGAASTLGRGDGGAGNGGGAGEEPCGFVTFSDPHGSRFDSATHGFWVDIKMSVHFADRSLQSILLDYPWYYPSEAANPWSGQNLRDPNFPTRFQPPPSEKLASEPPLVRYVIAHSTPDGMTILKDCPATASPAGN
ncbi:MAG: hypothetical protein JO030_01125 [Candidatus Eremiobacteraeota bacterium]|nr:hypothetical protein [Candidatus Eremiobacteraeota bacterium]